MVNPSVAARVPKIADFLQALSSPTRLQIMQALSRPHRLGDVCVSSNGNGPHISRQAVRRHLDILMDKGLVKRLPGPTKNQDTYLLNRGGLFLVADQIQQLIRIEPASLQGVDPDRTRTASVWESPRAVTRPRLMTVYGPDDGVAYPIGESRREWIIGRGEASCIRIEHDPCISHRHARVTKEEDGFYIQDMDSRNGVFLNLRRVGERPVPWRTGDVVTVGRTRLLMQA